MVCILLIIPSSAQAHMSDEIIINHVASDFAVSELDSVNWQNALKVEVDRYWSGKKAPSSRHFSVRMLWTDTALYVRFEANQNEPLIVSEKPSLATKTDGLWNRDVCEIFIAPDKTARGKYFEFEIAPNGEWIDLGIEVLPKKRLTDMEFRSGMTSAVRIEKETIIMAIKIPFSAFGKTPKVGDTWLGNLFRCIGKDPGRGYLAWLPTMTRSPNFHVPERFGRFVFRRP